MKYKVKIEVILIYDRNNQYVGTVDELGLGYAEMMRKYGSWTNPKHALDTCIKEITKMFPDATDLEITVRLWKT